MYGTLQVEYKSPNMEWLGLKRALSRVSNDVSVKLLQMHPGLS